MLLSLKILNFSCNIWMAESKCVNTKIHPAWYQFLMLLLVVLQCGEYSLCTLWAPARLSATANTTKLHWKTLSVGNSVASLYRDWVGSLGCNIQDLCLYILPVVIFWHHVQIFISHWEMFTSKSTQQEEYKQKPESLTAEGAGVTSVLVLKGNLKRGGMG